MLTPLRKFLIQLALSLTILLIVMGIETLFFG